MLSASLARWKWDRGGGEWAAAFIEVPVPGLGECVQKEGVEGAVRAANGAGLNELIAQAITFFTKDTVFTAMGLMQQHKLGRVAVVREDDGEYVGDLRVEDLYRAWATDPLMTLAEVLTRAQCGDVARAAVA